MNVNFVNLLNELNQSKIIIEKQASLIREKDSTISLHANIIKNLRVDLLKKEKTLNKLKAQLKFSKKYSFQTLDQFKKFYFDYSIKSKYTIRRNLLEIFNNLNLKLNKLNLQLVGNLNICEKNPTEVFYMCIKKNFIESNDIKKFLYYKDKYALSDNITQALRNEFNLNVPSLYSIKEFRNKLNNDLKERIAEFDDGIGFFINPEQKLKMVLKYTINKDSSKFQNKKIMIKFSGDGTVLCRGVKLMIFVLSIINEGIKATTVAGTYLIGICFIVNECYDEIKKPIQAIWGRMTQLSQFDLNHISYQIQYFISGDRSFTQEVS